MPASVQPVRYVKARVTLATLALLWADATLCLPSPALAADAAHAVDSGKARAGSAMVVPLGVTARDMAADHAPAGVTQDQMLVALQRANPNAFAGGNINRLLAGASLALPSAEQALQVSEGKAKQIIAAQGREFNAQQQLQSAAPALPPGSSTEGRTPAPQPADSPQHAAPTAAEASAAPAAATPETNLPPTPAAAVSEPGGGVTPAVTPTVDASVNLAKTGLISQLIDHPAVLPTTGGLLVLMAALAVLRSRQRRQASSSSGPSAAGPETTPAEAEAKFDPRLNAALLAGEAAAVALPARAEAVNTAPAPAPEVPTALRGHFDLDLSLGHDSTAASAPVAAMPVPSTQPVAALGNNPPVPKAKPAPEFDLGSISLDLGSATSAPDTSNTPSTPFNMSSISLDLGNTPTPPPPADKAAP